LITKKPGRFPDFHKITGELFSLEELFTVFYFDICLAVAWDGVLNSSMCWQTTHTQAGHTGAEHYNSHHQVLIGVIISALTDLSIQLF
jgi:hypothetical protein